MSRVAKLMPDKVATALAINQEPALIERDDDGSYLVDLVAKLAKVYLEQAKQLKNLEEAAEQEDGVYRETVFSIGVEPEPVDAAVLDFDQTVEHFLATLEALKGALKGRNLEDIRRIADEVIHLSDDILTCCVIFLDVVHPVWIRISRKGSKDEPEIEQIQARVRSKLERLNGCSLFQEFSKLVRDEEVLLK